MKTSKRRRILPLMFTCFCYQNFAYKVSENIMKKFQIETSLTSWDTILLIIISLDLQLNHQARSSLENGRERK